MKKSLFGIAAVAALVGIVLVGTNLEAAGPKLSKSSVMKRADGVPLLKDKSSQAAGAAVSLNYSTGFEAAQGFTPRDATCVQDTATCPGGYAGQCGFIGDGTQGSGPYPEPWAVSGSNAGNIEGHIDTVHPFSGTQHLRVSKDLCDNTAAFSFSVDARVPASPPQVGEIAPATYSGQIAIATGVFGADVFWQPQSNSQGYLTSRTMFFYYGFFYILDDYGTGTTYVPVFTYWDASGAYQPIAVHHDPCAKFMCLDGGNAQDGQPCPNGNVDCRFCAGGANDGSPCVASFQCPDGTCEGGNCTGRIDYWYGGNLIYQGTTYAGTTSEQFLIYTDNFPGDNDVDDLVIETGDPCPTVCGNNEVEPGEQCDGANDDNCPGRCQADCTCIITGISPCEADPLPNGTTSVITHGGWWTFTADTEATAVETCGTTGFDSYMYLLTGACDSLEYVRFNDDCDDSSYGYGADPLASCYTPGGIASPYNSCTCAATTIGQQYWVYVGNGSIGGNNVVTLNKRQDCAAVWAGGACCDGYGNCTDDVAGANCAGKGDVWTENKYCSTVEPCAVTLGACCDAAPGLGGACTDAATADECTGTYQTFSLGAMCADVTCTEIRGACCNGFTGTCSQTLQGDCQGQNMTWTVDTPCAGITCTAIPGACCNHINPDPLATVGVCTDGVVQADCVGDDVTWTKGSSCSAVPCPATFQAIPTVSEWGLVVLALLLLVGAKVYFGRREALA